MIKHRNFALTVIIQEKISQDSRRTKVSKLVKSWFYPKTINNDALDVYYRFSLLLSNATLLCFIIIKYLLSSEERRLSYSSLENI
jgi:hypothetical protein